LGGSAGLTGFVLAVETLTSSLGLVTSLSGNVELSKRIMMQKLTWFHARIDLDSDNSAKALLTDLHAIILSPNNSSISVVVLRRRSNNTGKAITIAKAQLNRIVRANSQLNDHLKVMRSKASLIQLTVSFGFTSPNTGRILRIPGRVDFILKMIGRSQPLVILNLRVGASSFGNTI
jgi:hypothetical protein